MRACVKTYKSKCSKQPKKAMRRNLHSFLIKHFSACSPITLQMLSGNPRRQHSSSDTSSKRNNLPCLHLPILFSANLKAFHTIGLLRQRSNKRCCQLTRWKNILLIFLSLLPSPHQQEVLMCRDEGWITACLGEA